MGNVFLTDHKLCLHRVRWAGELPITGAPLVYIQRTGGRDQVLPFSFFRQKTLMISFELIDSFSRVCRWFADQWRPPFSCWPQASGCSLDVCVSGRLIQRLFTCFVNRITNGPCLLSHQVTQWMKHHSVSPKTFQIFKIHAN